MLKKKKSKSKYPSKPAAIGRSAATGQYVLKPVSKSGKLTMREAKTAVRSYIGSTKLDYK